MGGLPTSLTTRGQAIPNPKALAEGSKISLAGRQVPKPRCLSPAAHSLDARIAGRQVPDLHGVSKQLYLGRIAWIILPEHPTSDNLFLNKSFQKYVFKKFIF